MNPESVSINNTRYVREDLAKTNPEGDMKIVVLQRGWVLVGTVSVSAIDPNIRILSGASVIRVWGTSKGLGELRDGPTSSTKLDPVGTAEFHILTQVLAIPVNAEAWKANLK